MLQYIRQLDSILILEIGTEIERDVGGAGEWELT